MSCSFILTYSKSIPLSKDILFQKKPKDVNFASEEQKLSEEEDDIKVLAEKNLEIEKPDLITEGNDSLVLQAPDHMESSTDLASDPVPSLKKVSNKGPVTKRRPQIV